MPNWTWPSLRQWAKDAIAPNKPGDKAHPFLEGSGFNRFDQREEFQLVGTMGTVVFSHDLPSIRPAPLSVESISFASTCPGDPIATGEDP